MSSNQRDVANLAPLYGPILRLSFFFIPGSPIGRVATAGECKCHPVLPVNYTATKLIVCLVHSKKDAALAIDWPFVSHTDAALSFSHSLDLMVV